jgi:anti-sigma factor RsiW
MTVEHLDEEMIQRLLHDEVPVTNELAARNHVDACAECRNRLTLARREEADLFSRLEVLDVPMPSVTLPEILARSANSTAPVNRRVAWRWAAGILFALGLSGVAYAAPGSPLRAVLAKLVSWIRPSPEPPATGEITPTAAAGGVMMDVGERVMIELRSVQPFDSLVVTLADASQIAVRSLGGAVTFNSDVDRLSISNASGAARIEVVIPRTAARVEIVAGGQRLYAKNGGTIISTATDTTGGRHLILPARR